MEDIQQEGLLQPSQQVPQGTRALALEVPGHSPALVAAPDVAATLGLSQGETLPLAFGLRSLPVTITTDAGLPPGAVALSRAAVQPLLLPVPGPLGLYRSAGGLRAGPLVAVLVAARKLSAVLSGAEDTVYERYRRYAEEVGAVLCFLSVAGLDLESLTVQAGQLTEQGWQQIRIPLPRVIYDRCFGAEGRAEAHLMRQIATLKGVTVVNRPVKITKLESFQALGQIPELAPVLPPTLPLTPEHLAAAMAEYPVVYLKPNNLYKGQGVYRVRRVEVGWEVASTPEDPEVAITPLRVAEPEEVLQLLPTETPYLVQAGIPLARYLGNPYDFRSLVQKAPDRWQVTGLVARIAPEQGVVTSPRSGGLVSPAARVLCHSFGQERGLQILKDLEACSIRIAAGIEEQMGPCVELGLDLGVTTDGRVQLIEVNGKPLKVSLFRLADPGITARINRCPIHAVAHMDLTL